MSDMPAQLQSILSSPEGMERIRAMAENLFGGAVTEPAPPASDPPMPDAAGIARIAEMIKPRQDDERVRLLLALKPHLGPERQTRVDKAVKILRLLDMAPMLSKLGLFEL